MSRQVDIKALISHIVRGDGADKCRICMGDTSEGQVYLGDTVMMDGNRSVTLSELLAIITGVEVSLDGDLPGGLCPSCTESALSAAAFRGLCQQSSQQWHKSVEILESLPVMVDFKQNNSLYIVLKKHDSEMNIEIIPVENKHNIEKSESDESNECRIPRDKTKIKRRIISAKSTGKVCKCPDCEKAFINPKQLYDHLKDSTENKRSCYICASIMTREELVKHLKRVHDSKLYGCKKCHALLRNMKQLRRHSAVAHKHDAHYCGDCGRSFKSHYALRGHINVHLNKNCPRCDKTFRNLKCYSVHVRKCCNLDDAHRSENKVMFEVENIKNQRKLKVGARGKADMECICDYCGKTYAGKKFVAAHIQIVHMKNTHRPCPYCGISYASAHMTEHIKKHEKVLSFTCEYCGFLLKTKLGYIQHIRLHTGEKPYNCKYCTATFSASSRRSEHVRNTHKTDEIVLKHCCAFCPAKFRLPYRLKKHIETVHGRTDDIKVKEFECSECHIKFSSCRGLLYHSRRYHSLRQRQ